MASLAAALVERQKVAALERAERAQRVQLVADPLVTVQGFGTLLGFQEVFRPLVFDFSSSRRADQCDLANTCEWILAVQSCRSAL